MPIFCPFGVKSAFISFLGGLRLIMEFKEQQAKLNGDYRTKLNRLADRIEACPSLPWCHLHCSDCGTQLTKKPFKTSCLSNFCSDDECLKNRKKIRMMKFKEYNIKSKKLYSFVIGFKDISVKDLTKKQRVEYHKFFMKVIKKTQKIYGKFYFLSVRDINNSGQNIRLHYHIATLPLRDFRFFVQSINKVCFDMSKKANIDASISLSGYKGTGPTLKYFSGRVCGEFGHHRKGEHKFGYSDFLNLQQYFEVFYRSKSFNCNFQYRSRKRAELVLMLNNVPKKCPNCGSTTHKNFYFLPVVKINDVNPPPSSQQEDLNIQIIKV